MIKKIAKVVLVLLMVFGAVISISNVMDSELHAGAGKWVKYWPNIPDCFGEGKTCFDFTNPDG